MSKKNMGSSLDSFLEEEELLAEVQAEAAKRVIVWQIEQYLEKNQLSKVAFAKMLNTSRSQLDRLLDPENTRINMQTLFGVAEIMGKQLELRLH